MDIYWIRIECYKLGVTLSSQFSSKKAAAEWMAATVQDMYLEDGVSSYSQIMITGGP
jgi:hypothetical protein